MIGLLMKLRFIRQLYVWFGSGGLKYFIQKLTKPKNSVLTLELQDKHKLYIRKNTSDEGVLYQCFINKEYDIPMDKTPKTIIDLGANTGFSSVFFKNKYPEAKIVAVEPEKSNYDLLVKNITNLDNVFAYNAAIWHRQAHLTIEDKGWGHWGYVVNEVDEHTKDAIKAISIDQLMEDHAIERIDLLKVDIEGSEKDLFSTGYEKWLAKTDLIVIELHDVIKAGASKAFFKAISNYNFDLKIKGENLICKLDHSTSS